MRSGLYCTQSSARSSTCRSPSPGRRCSRGSSRRCWSPGSPSCSSTSWTRSAGPGSQLTPPSPFSSSLCAHSWRTWTPRERRWTAPSSPSLCASVRLHHRNRYNCFTLHFQELWWAFRGSVALSGAWRPLRKVCFLHNQGFVLPQLWQLKTMCFGIYKQIGFKATPPLRRQLRVLAVFCCIGKK
jgi:hypothetical protein